MTELPNIFENAKVGDDVLCIRRGWLVIDSIHRESNYPINAGYSSYMLDGRYLECDKAPSLWPADKVPQYYLDLFPRPKKKKVKKVIERWVNVYPTGCREPYTIGKLLDTKDEAIQLAAFENAIQVSVFIEYEVEE